MGHNISLTGAVL